jgi:serine/threonine protein kinase
MSCLEENTIVAWLAGDLPEAERAAIELHLDDCGACHALVAEAAQHLSATVDASPDAPLDRGRFFARGDRVARYTLLECVGAGGMGVVYAARDEELQRKVALKVLRTPHGDASERLLVEAQTLARLAHPNVVAVFDVGRVDGRVFLAMEFVEGRSLRSWLARAPRSRAEILAMYEQAGRALEAAHAQKIIHRDFKPDNVMVGDDGRVRVIDFGLARSASGEASREEAHEEERPRTRLAGTPGYMAPELLEGQSADEKSDQYAFAVSLFESLYGKRPPAMELPVSERGTAVAYALTRALSADPAARFASIRALLDALVEPSASLPPKRSAAPIGIALGILVAALAAWGLANRSPPARESSASTLTPVTQVAPTSVATLASAMSLPSSASPALSSSTSIASAHTVSSARPRPVATAAPDAGSKDLFAYPE